MPDVFISNPPKKSPVSVIPVDVPKSESQKIKLPGHTHNRFSAFSLYPESVDFETREHKEKVILMLRAHPITNLRWILGTFLMLLVPWAIKMFGFFATLPAGIDLVVTLAFYLLTVAYALENFLGWYFNVYIVTNLRVVDVDFYNLIYKQVSDANIDKIQDVTYTMGGVTRTIFNYGNVFIQTAAEVQEFEFLAVPNPDKVAKIIQDLITKTND